MKRLLWACAMVAVGILTGCGSNEAGSQHKRIGASLLTQSHIFYQDMVRAMEDEAQKQGFVLDIQYAEFNGSKQNDHMDTFILQRVDAIVVAPTDSDGISPVIAEARSQGIPVFTADIAAHGADVVSHIASDNVEGGRLIGDYLAKQLGGKGKIAIVDHPEAASVQERVKGFKEALGKYPEMEIVQSVQGGGQRDKALQVTQDLLQSRPELNAIFGINDDSALGALAAVQSAGLQDKIIIVGYDGTPEARAEILKGGPLKADTVQHPEDIGRTTIQVIADYFAGKEVPKTVPVRVNVVDAETLKAEGGA